ncbi:DNA phosphorothioation-associated putative methyltransferase, partial [Akkermansiaceae bacterium]|nr:DNA phosphorothioation-associated putative methyltransferase [Akkermansiaceae bacterium]
MNFLEYRAALKELPIGKELPDSIYIHIDGLSSIPENLLEIITEIQRKLDSNNEFNILKLHKRQFRISLLCYPDFDSDAHPSLKKSILVDLEKGTAKSATFDHRANPPILHRKEAFLPLHDKRIEVFSALTKQAELLGLYQDTKTIGFRKNWENLLASKGLSIEGHSLVHMKAKEQLSPVTIEVDRHKTAMVRYDFSKPVKNLIQSGLLDDRTTILDYGCGHGADVTGLKKLGHDVAAWDPVHLPNGLLKKSKFVNIGYVINVIENPTERVETLLNAWDYTEKLLVVSAMVRGGDSYANAKAYGDGVITSSNTFQKYFEQSELQVYIETALQQDAIAAAPGIFFIFRHDADQQDYLASRSRRVIDWGALSARLGFGSPPTRGRTPRLSTYEKHKELLDDFWETFISLGRTPYRDEYKRSDEVRKACQSIARAVRLFEDKYGTQLLEERRARRTEDLKVYLANEEFKKRRTPISKLSPGLRRDIKAFFPSYSEACEEARGLLFAAGDTMEVEIAVENLDFGYYDDDEGHFLFHRSLLDELPAILRVYVGCGALLYGDLSDIDLFKIHITSGKLTLQSYKGFDRLNLPELQTRIKIDLRRLSIRVFEAEENKTQLLYFKERLLPKDSPL